MKWELVGDANNEGNGNHTGIRIADTAEECLCLWGKYVIQQGEYIYMIRLEDEKRFFVRSF